MSKFSGFHPPEQNWSKLPHELIGALHLISSLGELKVILYVLRHTWGYQDERKRITLDEFMNGRRCSEKKAHLACQCEACQQSGILRLDHGTGLSKNAIKDGLKRAVTDGFIDAHTDASDKARIKKYYALSSSRGSTSDPHLEGQLLTLWGSTSDPRTIERNLRKKDIADAKKNSKKSSFSKPVSLLKYSEITEKTLTLTEWKTWLADEKSERNRKTVIAFIERKINTPPAIREFHLQMGRWPKKTLWADVDAVVGRSPEKLKFWGEVVKKWAMRNYNPLDLDRMLACFKSGKLPADYQDKNGQYQDDNRTPSPTENLSQDEKAKLKAELERLEKGK